MFYCIYYYCVVLGVYMHIIYAEKLTTTTKQQQNTCTIECLLLANLKARNLLPKMFTVKKSLVPCLHLDPFSCSIVFLLAPYLTEETQSHCLRNLDFADQFFFTFQAFLMMLLQLG